MRSSLLLFGVAISGAVTECTRPPTENELIQGHAPRLEVITFHASKKVRRSHYKIPNQARLVGTLKTIEHGLAKVVDELQRVANAMESDPVTIGLGERLSEGLERATASMSELRPALSGFSWIEITDIDPDISEYVDYLVLDLDYFFAELQGLIDDYPFLGPVVLPNIERLNLAVLDCFGPWISIYPS